MNAKTKQEIIEVAGRIANARTKLSADEQELEALLAKIAAKPVIDKIDAEAPKLTKAVLKLREEKPRTPPPREPTEQKAPRNTGMRGKIIDLLNDEPERIFQTKEIMECIGSTSVAGTGILLGELVKEGFIRRISRGFFRAQTNPEPKQGREDGDEVQS